MECCLHRDCKLCNGSGQGAKQFKCKYHAWTWKLDGDLAFYPGDWDFPEARQEDYGLRPTQIDTWGGFVFINPDLKAGPLRRQLASMVEHFKRWPLEDRYTIWHVRKTINANSKVAMEAFLEGYHLAQTYPQALPSIDEHAAQYDVWDEGESAYSRSITPTAIPSKHGPYPDGSETIGHAWALLAGLRAKDEAALPRDIKDRASLAAWRRAALQQHTDADYTQMSDAEMLDSVQCWSFPNFCPW